MGRNNIIKSVNRCKCCLEEDDLKDMWKEHYSDGELEIYGDLIRDCFVLPWYPPSMNRSEYICESCIIRLRVAVSFRKGMLLSEQTLKEYFDRESEPRVKREEDSDVDLETKYLEDENSLVVIKKEIKIEVDESDTQVSTYKTNYKYTRDDLNKCLEAVKSKTLTQVEASIIYDIPKRIISETMSGSDTDSEYGSGAGPSTKKKSHMEIGHKNCVTTRSKRDFKANETELTDVQSQRLYKAPKTAAERARDFRKRKALLKQQNKELVPDEVKSAAGDIRNAGPSEDNKVPGPWTENKDGVSESSKSLQRQPKTPAQRMREYRQRKKLAKKIAQLKNDLKKASHSYEDLLKKITEKNNRQISKKSDHESKPQNDGISSAVCVHTNVTRPPN